MKVALTTKVLLVGLLLFTVQGCVSKEKANQKAHLTNKQRALRVFSFGQFRANAFLLKPGLALTNKHVCDTPDFYLVNNEGVAKAPINMTSSTDYDLCVIKLDISESFDGNIAPLKVYPGDLELNSRVELLGYSLRRTHGEPPPVLTRSSGMILEVVDLITGQTQDASSEMYAQYFNDNIASTLPIVPGCSGSPIYAPNGALVGVANAVTSEGLGVFVKSSNLVKFLKEAGVEYASADSIN